MAEPLQQFKTALKTHSQSLTRSRLEVFSALQDKEPQTMREIVQACVSKVDRASVYRTIALFERLGIVQRLQIGWKYKLELSDAFHHHHHHLTCLKCGKTIRLSEDRQLEARLHGLARAQNFVMQGHQLEIQGLCENCH
jgi:Fur family ferric uptake transcriptional regulator